MPFEIVKTRSGYKVKNVLTGRALSKKSLPYSVARAQLRAVNRNYYNEKNIYGRGLFDAIKNVGKSIVKIGDKVTKRISNIINNSGSPQTDAILQKFGQWNVTGFEIVRTPIESQYKKLLNIISLGKFNKYKENYDDVFHLLMIIRIENYGFTKYLLTEKRPNILWTEVNGYGDHKGKLEDTAIGEINAGSLQDVVGRAVEILGQNFHKYTATQYNCQNYILTLLHAMGVTKYDDFVQQDISKFINSHTGIIANAVTSLGHLVGRIQGKGILGGQLNNYLYKLPKFVL